MSKRALLLVGAFLALPARSQEPAPQAPPTLTPRSFDLRAESVKKIVRETAATQYAALRLSEAKPMEPAAPAASTVVFVPPEKWPPSNTGKLSLPRMPPQAESGFLSHVISSLIDEALGVEPDDPVETQSISWLSCQARIDLKQETLGNGSCND